MVFPPGVSGKKLFSPGGTDKTMKQKKLQSLAGEKMGGTRNKIQLIDDDLMDRMLEQVQGKPRRRTNFNFHADMSDNPHRFLNVMLRGTYVAPHKHENPPKAESFLVLRGSLGILIFDEQGTVLETHLLGEGSSKTGIDISPGVWHSLVVLSESVVCFEVKPGPYRVDEDKQFAPWAPEENQEGWENYLQLMESQFVSG